MQLYRSTDINVWLHEGKSDFTLITFAPLNHPTDGLAFWGDSFIKKAGIRAIGVVAQTPNWYPLRSMVEAATAIRAHVPPGSRVATYGASMGAYAAIKYSRALQADTVIAFAPQFTIDPSHPSLKLNPFSHYYDDALHNQMVIGPDDCSGRLFLLFDPFYRFDRQNAELISAQTKDVTHVPLFFSGHDAVRMFAGTETGKRLVHACLERDVITLKRVAHTVRKNTPLRARELCARLAKRNPLRAEALFERYGEKLNTADRAAFFVVLSENLIKFGFIPDARRIMDKLIVSRLDDPRLVRLSRLLEAAEIGMSEEVTRVASTPLLRRNALLLSQKFYSGRFKTIPAGVTLHQCLTTETSYDAVRLIYMNDLPTSYRIKAASVAPSSRWGPAPTDDNGKVNHALWRPVTFGNDGNASVDVVGAAAPGEIASTFSNLVRVEDMPPLDSSLPILMVRTFLASPGRSPFSPEQDRLLGGGDNRFLFKKRMLQAYARSLDGVTSPEAFTSPTNSGSIFPAAHQMLARHSGLTIMGVGDSLIQGGAPTPFPAWGARLCSLLSSQNLPVSWFSSSTAGMKSARFYAQAEAMLDEVNPEIVFIATHSTNDSLYDVEGGLKALSSALRLANKLIALGAIPIFMTPVPNSKTTGLPGEVRSQVTQHVRRLAKTGSFVLYAEDILGDGNSPPRLRDVFDFGDGIHLSEAGQDAMAIGALPVVARCLARVTTSA